MSPSVLPVREQAFQLACFRWAMPLATSVAQQRYLEPQAGILKYLDKYLTKDMPAEFLLRCGQYLLTRNGDAEPSHWKLDARAGDGFQRRGHIAILKMGPIYMWCRIMGSRMGHDWWPEEWTQQ